MTVSRRLKKVPEKMNNSASAFHLIADLTEEKGVTCILIGGFAVNHYKVTRQTTDVDFLTTKAYFEKIADSLEKAGYKKDLVQETFIQLKGSESLLMDMDFMFVDEGTLKKIQDRGVGVKIAGRSFTVPALHDLLALKLHSIKFNPKIRMNTDFPDIINLMRANDVNVKEKKFKELCLRFGTHEVYEKLLEAFR